MFLEPKRHQKFAWQHDDMYCHWSSNENPSYIPLCSFVADRDPSNGFYKPSIDGRYNLNRQQRIGVLVAAHLVFMSRLCSQEIGLCHLYEVFSMD